MSLHSVGTVETDGSDVLEQQDQLGPRLCLRQAWDRPSLQGISREVEGHGVGRCWKLLFWCPSAGGGRPQLRMGMGAVDKEDGGSGGEWVGESVGAMMLWSESPSSKGRPSGVSQTLGGMPAALIASIMVS